MVKTAVTAASAAVVAFGVDSVKTGMEFDTAMSQISATLGYSTADIENNINGAADTFNLLREKARQMGSETNFSATQAAEGLNILAMSGYDAEQSMSMIEDVLHLAAAGAMDMSNAAGYVAGAMKGFNDETKDSAYYADLMAKGATLAATDVSQLGEALSDASATASSYGQSADSVTLALLRLAEQGVTGTAASTALSAAMKNLYAPTDQAKQILQELGVNAFDPATGAARDFNAVVNELDAALSGYSDEQKTAYAQTIFGIQGFDAYNKMVVTSIDKQNEWANALANSSGEAAKQYETMTNNLTGDLDKFKSAIGDAQIALSGKFTPALRDMVQIATNFVSNGGIEKLVDSFISLSPAIAAATAAMVAYKAASSIAGIIDLLTKATEGQTIAQIALNAVMNANPFVLVATAIAALVAGIFVLWNTNEDFRNAVIEIWESVKGAFVSAWSAVESAWGAAGQFFSDIWSSIENTFSTVVDFFGNLFQSAWTAIQNAWSSAVSWFSDIWESIRSAFSVAESTLGGFFSTAWSAIQSVWSVVTGYFQNIWATIEGIFAVAEAVLSGDFSAAWAAIQGIVSTWTSYFSGVWDNIKTVFFNAFNTLKSNALQWGKDLIDNFVSGIKSKISAVTSAVSNIASTVKSFIGFSEPEKGPLSNFHTYAPDMMKLFAEGIRDNAYIVQDQLDKSLDFDFGTATVDFASSGLGVSSAGIVNGIAGAATNGGATGPITINLMFPDGTKLATYQLPFLIDVARANGTPIYSPA